MPTLPGRDAGVVVGLPLGNDFVRPPVPNHNLSVRVARHQITETIKLRILMIYVSFTIE